MTTSPRHVLGPLWLALLLLPAAAAARTGPLDAISYAVTARVADDGSTVSGTVHVAFHNRGPAPLDHLVLLLYPTRFRRVEPELNDLTFPRVYPGPFDPGDMVLTGADVEPVDFGLAPEGTYVRLPLDEPVEPGGIAEIDLTFETTVPRRFGTFARHQWMVCLNGGWTPQVAARDDDGAWDLEAPPPAADWALELTYAPDLTAAINGATQGSDGAAAGATVAAEALFAPGHLVFQGRARFLTLVLHRGGTVTTVDTAAGPLTYVGQPPTTRQTRDLRRVAEGALGLLRSLGLPGAADGVVVAEAPLRWKLVEQGEGMVLVSDRFLEVDPSFRRFEQTQLARAVMTDRLLPAAEEVEAHRDAPPVAEAVAWALLPRYLASRYRFNPTAQELLRPLDFIPSVEQFLYAPSYPFADEVLNNPYQFDPLRADIRRYHRGGISPRISLLKVKERVGTLSVDAAATAYVRSLGGDAPAALPFLDRIEADTGGEVRGLWDSWERDLPTMNYRLRVDRQRLGDGGWSTTIGVTREVPDGTPLVRETVEVEATVRAAGRHRPREQIRLRWDGEGDGTRWTLHTRRRIAVVALDPDFELLEIDPAGFLLRADDRVPRRLKVYPYGYVGAISLSDGTFEAMAGLAGRAAFDNHNLFSANAFHSEETMVGVSGVYYRYFGRARDALFRRNRVGLATSMEVLNQRFATVSTAVPLVFTAILSYRYDDSYGSWFPTRGGRLYASVHAGHSVATELPSPGDSPAFVGALLSGSIRLPLHPRLVLALRGKAGVTTATLPHMQLVIGGSDDLRGLPEHYATGHLKGFTCAELRWLPVRDLDWRLPLGRLRGIQLVAFVEAGWVGDGAPRAEEMAAGLGGGLRFHFDALGIWPTAGGFDVGWSPRAPRGNLLPWPVQIYLVVGQSF